MTSLTLSKDIINKAILAFEVSWSEKSGFDVYNRKYRRPIVPAPETTDSGVTLGFGFDCGYNTPAEIKAAWGSILPMNDVELLCKCSGKKKFEAVGMLPSVKHIDVSSEMASLVFYTTTMSKFAKQAYKIWPEIVKIHPVEQTVLVGLVYNRGNDTSGDRRREMKDLKLAIAKDNDAEMASLIRSMKRLWKNTKGLLIRRDAEAALIELADIPIPDSDKLVITV